MRRWGIFPHTFEIPDPDLPIHYTTFMALRLRQMELSAKTMYGHVVKVRHVSIERCYGRPMKYGAIIFLPCVETNTL